MENLENLDKEEQVKINELYQQGFDTIYKDYYEIKYSQIEILEYI